MKLMVISKRFIVASLIMGTYLIVWRLFFSSNIIVGTAVALLLTGIMFMLYMEEIKKY
jgi:hypothetical protein